MAKLATLQKLFNSETDTITRNHTVCRVFFQYTAGFRKISCVNFTNIKDRLNVLLVLTILTTSIYTHTYYAVAFTVKQHRITSPREKCIVFCAWHRTRSRNFSTKVIAHTNGNGISVAVRVSLPAKQLSRPGGGDQTKSLRAANYIHNVYSALYNREGNIEFGKTRLPVERNYSCRLVNTHTFFRGSNLTSGRKTKKN